MHRLALSTPPPMAFLLQATLEKQTVWKAANAEMPEWAHRVGDHRDAFRDVVLALNLGLGEEQQPPPGKKEKEVEEIFQKAAKEHH